MSGRPFLLPPGWTVIAERQREPTGRELLYWHERPGTFLRLSEAHRLAAKGVILMANRHFPDRVELVVRPLETAETQPSEQAMTQPHAKQFVPRSGSGRATPST
jgi:hypothetical protein